LERFDRVLPEISCASVLVERITSIPSLLKVSPLNTCSAGSGLVSAWVLASFATIVTVKVGLAIGRAQLGRRSLAPVSALRFLIRLMPQHLR